ncbi:UDP-glucose dehydrogenase family protein [Alkalisalibacterium limincola]|uniref:UDP-glucose 6-dehydrogenase n=1 Tax=Alkalisalibacterium limincola TaxID=2699169 RepID=A0A5C8KXT5_9GAMM|nr:UDP-glucose/GDP-mannose dehydrogenase family protein [Alkalisalibacterium limincola]TXK65596.1 UDP-glucose/GDP-mannose dehydrogenase family protein [Alkalisalibacterium limincola]
MDQHSGVTLFGTGYVGLVTGTCLAEVGHHVTCVDVDAQKVEGLCRGEIPIHEPCLAPMVARNLREGRLAFTTDAPAALQGAGIVFIAVGTPPNEDGSADLGHVLDVARTIGQQVTHPVIVVNKSTVPVGTADRVREVIHFHLRQRGLVFDVEVVSNPEFLKEGAAVADCMKPDRIILGTRSGLAAAALKRLYAPFNHKHERILVMDERSAELTKYAANAMLATKISFMNEVANIAERMGADVEAVRRGIGSDPRIGYQFIYPGMGYGGSCFPKDVKALAHMARSNGYAPDLLAAVDGVNRRQKSRLFQHIQRHYDGALAGRTFALWGLAFKPNTDDMREAPSRVLIERLVAAGARVRAYDPQAGDHARTLFADEPQVEVCNSAADALEGANALALVTEWKQFWRPRLDHLHAALSDRVIFDGRNVFEPWEVEAAGLAYHGIGRGRSVSTKAPAGVPVAGAPCASRPVRLNRA